MLAMSALPTLTPRQLWTLLALTLVWGFNWPIMKFGVSGFPPLSFRALSMWLGLPVVAFDVSFNRATTEDQALYFADSASLRASRAFSSVAVRSMG